MEAFPRRLPRSKVIAQPPNQALQGTSPNLQKQQRKFGAAPELGC